MAPRVPKAELPGELKESMVARLGVIPEPVEVTWNSPRVAEASLAWGQTVGAWDGVDASLKSFAHMAVAAQVGCSWCLDLGYFQAVNESLDLHKASQVPRWRDADVFTALERDVLEYAEAMTTTPPTVTDALSETLRDRLGAAGLVELTVFIAFANLATRSNVALGVESQGLSSACAIPLAPRSGVSAAA